MSTNSKPTIFRLHRLKNELEEAKQEYQQNLLQTQSKFTNEMSSLKEQISESQFHRDSLQKEASLLRDKVDHVRLENLTESEETIVELERIHEREKHILLDDNKRLMAELDKV